MKKIFIFLLLLSFNSLSFAAAFNSPSIVSKLDFKKNYFDSAYVGIGAGVLHVGGDVKNTILDSIINSSGWFSDYPNVISANNAANDDFSGNIFAGFGRKFKSFYLGSEIFFKYSKVNIDQAEDKIYTLIPYNVYSNIKLRSDYFYGINFRLGHLIDDKSIFYVLIGAEFGDFKYKVFHFFDTPFVPYKDQYQYHFDKTVSALRVGIGVESFFYKNLALRFEYIYSDYEKFKYHKKISKVINESNSYGSFADDKVNLSSGLLSLNFVYHIDGLKRR